MPASPKCESTRRQLPSGPSCQCHVLRSYTRKLKLEYRNEAPYESFGEAFDDIFRMAASIAIRSGYPLSPGFIGYYECLNELDALRCDQNQCHDQNNHRKFSSNTTCHRRENQHAGEHHFQAAHQLSEQASLEPPRGTNSHISLADHRPISITANPATILPQLESPAISTSVANDISESKTLESPPSRHHPSLPQAIRAQAAQPAGPSFNRAVRYITEDQLRAMGWKELFMLALARKVPYASSKSRKELISKFLGGFGGRVPIYLNDKLPKNFPSGRHRVSFPCNHTVRPGHRRSVPDFGK